ncbi:unnamed protein product [Anisakis simplex]|uniref:Lipid droplet-associated hydrolase n=1 Tax=Anisakis simplex TaxID=6269 RepID=A0A3P6P3A9_ANISI|nr:unnamed protein product [Anisakis simplex]
MELDATLLKYSDRIRFYYGTSDAWCPLEFGYEMRKRLGDELVSIDDSDCKHAFVISDNEVMARKVVDWIIA